MDPLSLPDQIARRDADRLRRYREYLDFYHGRQWTGTPRRRERRLTFNYARAIIDKVTSYLLTGLDFAVDPPEQGDAGRVLAARTEGALRRVWEDNALDLLDFDTEIDAAILGDAAFKVTWDPSAGRVRVTAPDVQGLFAWWRGDDPAAVWRVACRYQLAPEEVDGLFHHSASTRLSPRRGGGAAGSAAITVVEGWTDGWWNGGRTRTGSSPT